MREIFMKGRLAGISNQEIEAWLVNTDDFNPRTWSLKRGAPKKVVDLFPDYIDYCLTTGQDRPEYSDASVDYSDTSALYVRIWQLARESLSLVETGAASNVSPTYLEKIRAHTEELERLRDQVHDALLTDEDKVNGGASRLER